MYSTSINKLIESLKRLPSVGQRTAERFVFYLLKAGKRDVLEMMKALGEVIDKVKSCETCWDFSEANPCPICQDPKRDHSTTCVVLDSQDLHVIEQSGAYHGVYHVLRGILDPTDEESLERMKIKELFGRIRETATREVILALNPDLPGETTMLYLEKELKNIKPQLVITRLARGLPMGADLRYADEITLESAIKNRVRRD